MRDRVTVLLAAVVVISPLAAFSNPTTSGDSTAAVFAKIKLSLGLIMTSKGAGSAICINSSPTSSYYLTNAHVVGDDNQVTVFKQYPTFSQLKGTVIARGLDEDPDLAVVSVPLGNIPATPLFLGDLREGDPVAIAGYPSAQYTLAEITGSLTPAVHTGTISAIQNRGGIIEYDAQTLPGNSGGPLFDPRTGAVVGLVQAKLVGTTDANIAIGVGRVIAPFLSKNSVAFTRLTMPDPEGTPVVLSTSDDSTVLKALPGADVVAIVYDDSRATGENTGNYIADAAGDFATKFARAFNVRTVVVDAPITTVQAVATAARNNAALIAVPYGTGFHELSSYTNRLGTYSKWDFSLRSAIIDDYAMTWSPAENVEKTVNSARDVQSVITSSLADLNDQIVAAFSKYYSAAADESVLANLFRYALAMPNGGRKAFFNLTPSGNGATAHVFDFGPAAEAGLQTGDNVLEVNGVSTSGKTQADLSGMLVAASASGPYDVLIETADGKTQHIKFESKPLSWFLEHRQLP